MARQTLSTFLSTVFTKKYTNPSSDIITVLAGLDQVDTIFTDFVGALDAMIRNGRSCEHVFGCRPTHPWRRLTTCSGSPEQSRRGSTSRGFRSVPDQLVNVLHTTRPLSGSDQGIEHTLVMVGYWFELTPGSHIRKGHPRFRHATQNSRAFHTSRTPGELQQV